MQGTTLCPVQAVRLILLGEGQTRKATAIPYAGHLLRVAGIVIDEGGGETQATAVLLHDAVEDQGSAPLLLEIRERFA